MRFCDKRKIEIEPKKKIKLQHKVLKFLALWKHFFNTIRESTVELPERKLPQIREQEILSSDSIQDGFRTVKILAAHEQGFEHSQLYPHKLTVCE